MSEPSLPPAEAGNMPSYHVDAHVAQLVQPQGLTSRRKTDEKKFKITALYFILMQDKAHTEIEY